MKRTTENLKELLGELAESVSGHDAYFGVKTAPGKHYVVQTLLKTSGYIVTDSDIQKREIYATC